MPVLSAHDITKVYDHRTVLDGVSLTIDDGERIGVVGNNGCGKSTFGRVLAGVEKPDSGTVALRREAEVAYLAQEPRFGPGETVREAVMSGLGAWNAAHARYERAVEELEAGNDTDRWLSEQAAAADEVERLGGWERLHEAESLLGRLGVDDVDAPVDTLSGGRKRAVGLARVLLSQPALAILDEPTNHLDLDTIEWLETFLCESFRGALLLITHDRYVLDRVATRTVEIDKGSLTSFQGGYEAYLAGKAEREAHAERVEANRRNFVRQELAWLRRSPKARTTKQKARIARAESAIADVPPEVDKTAELRLAAARSGKTILETDALSVDVAGKRLVDGWSSKLLPGERIGIVGPNGCGKTSLIRALLGDLEPAEGAITVGKNTRIAYLDQRRSGLVDSDSVQQNIAGDGTHVHVEGRALGVHAYLERFLFDPKAARIPVGDLSGGERARVALAKMLAGEANLVILDEPTNDLDVSTLGALETMLMGFGGTALIVSHDRWFLDRLATAIFAFTGDGRVERFEGNYSEYREKAEAEQQSAAQQAAKAVQAERKAEKKPDGDQPKKLTYAERIELEGLMEKIEAAEEEVDRLESALAEPDVYSDGGEKVKTLMTDLEAAKESAAALTQRWEELESRAG